MSDVNLVMISGNLGKDPEERKTQSGKTLAKLRLANNEAWEEGGAKKKRTEWFNVVVFGNLAKACLKNLTSGRKVNVVGKLRNQEWTDGKGSKKTSMEINATQVQFL